MLKKFVQNPKKNCSSPPPPPKLHIRILKKNQISMDLKKNQNSMYGYMDLKKKLNIMYSKALRYAVFGSIKNRGFWFHKKPCSGGWTGANFFCLFVLDKFVKHVKKILTFWNFLNIKVTPD